MLDNKNEYNAPAGVPLRGAKTLPGFHPFLNPIPNRGISGLAGRAPQCGVPLRGAKTLRVFIRS
jgi:hypothetical protein